jgi:hypothetical protein
MPATARVPCACATVAMALGLGVALTTMSVADWNVTVLVRMAPEQPMAPLARATDPNFAFVHFHGRGDGVAYYGIARDPLALGEEHELFEWAPYRYGHPGYSWLAWLATAGDAALVPFAFLALNILGLGLAAGVSSLISYELGHSPWGGLVVALNPGLLYATTIDTSEPVSAALLALVLYGWLRGRRGLALVPLAFLCLTKEWFVLVAVGLAAWELLQVQQTDWKLRSRRAAATVALPTLAIVPFALWFAYVIVRFDSWPAAPAGELLQLPLTGWAKTARQAADVGMQTFDGVTAGHAALPLLAVSGVAFVFGGVRAIRLRNPIHPVYLALLPVVASLNHLNLLYTKDLMRTLAIPLALVPAVVVSSERWQARSVASQHLEPGCTGSR